MTDDTEKCFATYISGFSNALDCIREIGHEGNHRSFGGSEWRDDD